MTKIAPLIILAFTATQAFAGGPNTDRRCIGCHAGGQARAVPKTLPGNWTTASLMVRHDELKQLVPAR